MGLLRAAQRLVNAAWSIRQPSPDDDFWYQPAHMSAATAAGVAITPERAMMISTVYACVRLIAETVATLPIDVYRRGEDGNKSEDAAHPLNALLLNPNRWQTGLEFREMMQAHLLIRGNAYARILPANGEAFGELVPLNPDRVQPTRTTRNGPTVYIYQPDGGTREVLVDTEVLHIPGLSFDGVMGLSPIEYQREAMGMAVAAQDYGARFFKNDARPGVVLQHPGKMGKEAQERLKESWQKAQTGAGRHSAAVLEEGMTLNTFGVTNEQAQFLETRKYTAEEIMRVFRVPPPKVGELGRATWANIEELNIQFVQDCLVPWISRWEQRIARSLMSVETRATHYVKFNVNALLRGNLASRYSAYVQGIQNGWLSPNDVRRLEDMNPIEDGDVYLQPANLVPLGTEPAKESPEQMGASPNDEKPKRLRLASGD